MKYASLAAAALLAIATAAQAAPFAPGDWVLAQWRGDQYWFAGVVERASAASVMIAYDDGTRETRPANQVKRYDWRAGSRVQCDWKSAGEWYPGTITRTVSDGLTLAIRYDDGDAETTKTGKCRSL